MLQLKQLRMEDFGPFKGSQVLEFPSEGVAIVYGENMRGKTSLLNAIRFVFFGSVVGRGTKATALHKIGNWEKASEGKYGFQVELEFLSDGNEYKLTRTCTPRIRKPLEDSDYALEHFLTKNGDVLGPDQTDAELNRILPEQVSRFFLFDGELLQQYEDLLSNESDMGRLISEAIERILGVPILTSARATAMRLKEDSEKKEARAAQGDHKTREFGNQLQDIQAQREVLKNDLMEMSSKLNGLRVTKSNLEESLKRKERFAMLMEKQDGLKKQVESLSERLEIKEEDLRIEMGNAWCKVINPRLNNSALLLADEQKSLEADILQWEVLSELSRDSTASCPACFRDFSDEERRALEEQLRETSEREIQDKREKLRIIRQQVDSLKYFIDLNPGDVLRFKWNAVDEVAIDMAIKRGELAELAKQLENVDEVSLRKDKFEFEQTLRKIEVTERSVSDCRQKISDNEADAEQIQKRLDKLAGHDLQRERDKRVLYSNVHALLDESVAAYRDRLRKSVEADATRHFRNLTTEPEYSALVISESYGLTILHKDGETIPVRSAGAEHVVALCLVGALQNNAPLQGPIIIDSPFGRLDAGHTGNIVRALPEMARQVILLVYEDELPADIARSELRGKLRAEWHLDRRSARHTELVRRVE